MSAIIAVTFLARQYTDQPETCMFVPCRLMNLGSQDLNIISFYVAMATEYSGIRMA